MDELDLASMIRFLIQNRWLVLIVTSVVLAIGAMYSYTKVPQYESDVLLQIEQSSGLGKADAMAGQFLLRSPAADITSTQIALMKSRFILEPVIKSLGLDIYVRSGNSFFSRLITQTKNSLSVKSFTIPVNQLNQEFDLVYDRTDHISLFMNKIRVLAGNPSGLLSNLDHTISLDIKSITAPVGSHFTLQKKSLIPIVSKLSSLVTIREAGSESNKNTGILSVSLTGPDPKVIIRTLNSIALVTQNQDTKKKSTEAAQTLLFLYKRLPITKGELEKSENALNIYRTKSGKIDIKMQTQALLNQLSSMDLRLSELHIKKIDLLQRYTMEHPRLISLNLKTQTLLEQRSRLEKLLKKLPASDQIAVNLMREVGVKKALYLILLSKIQELEVIKAGTVSSVHILSGAMLPDNPLPSKRMLIYLASIVIGLVLSSIIIMLKRLIYPMIDDPIWCEKNFNLVNLAIIPYTQEQTDNHSAFKSRSLKIMPLMAYSNPKNLAVESLRSLRTSLQVTLTCASNNRIAIMGISPGVGKSFVSVNLAYLLAAAGKRVLLIDCDLRRGTLHQYMNVPASPGISELINRQNNIKGVLNDTIHPNLTFIPRGVYPEDPSELLMSDQFKLLMTTLSDEYDVVVIDTAPILMVTDAVIIGSTTATNYLLLGSGVHTSHDISTVLSRLSSSGVKLQGSIFNFHNQDKVGGYYGYYYGKNTSYYYDSNVSSQ